MAENSWDFYKANSSDAGQGVQGTHSSLSSPLNSATGSVYYRDFSSNSGVIKAVLTGSNFQGLDGSKAISMRAYVRMESEEVHKHFVFLAKTNNSNPSSTNSSYASSTVGYKVGIGDSSFSTNTIKGIYSLSTTNISLFSNDLFSASSWHLIRADIIPVYSGASITSDQIKLFKSTDNGSTWAQIGSTQTVAIGAANAWSHSTNKYYGFQTWGCYVDNFEVYLSTPYT